MRLDRNTIIASGTTGKLCSGRSGTPPCRFTDHAAEIASPEGRILVRQRIGLDVAACRVGLVLDGVVESLDDIFFDVLVARIACTTASRPASLYLG
jgi:hypothetical protein